MSIRDFAIEQSKVALMESMGEELGVIYEALWIEVASVHFRWSEYVVLFGTKKSRVDLLNNTVPSFARTIQDSLWEDVLLHIARLTDPPKSRGGQSNLTLRLLPEKIRHAETRATVLLLVEKSSAATEYCRDWRNRHIAHRDLHLALDTKAKPLKPASRQKVNDALRSLSAVLNAVSAHYLDSEILFDMETHYGGAMDLLYLIDDGANVAREKEKRMMDGKSTLDDFKPRDI